MTLVTEAEANLNIYDFIAAAMKKDGFDPPRMGEIPDSWIPKVKAYITFLRIEVGKGDEL